MPQLTHHNPKINWRIGEIKMTRCLEECGKQWRLRQKRLEWQKQKEENKQIENKQKKKKEKKKKKTKKRQNNKGEEDIRGIGHLG